MATHVKPELAVDKTTDDGIQVLYACLWVGSFEDVLAKDLDV